MITGAGFGTAAQAITVSGGSAVNNGGNAATFSGVISGSGGLTLAGAGTTTLSGTNTYTGGTTLTAGTVDVSADSNLGDASGGVTLDRGHAGERRHVHLGAGGDAGRRDLQPGRRRRR